MFLFDFPLTLRSECGLLQLASKSEQTYHPSRSRGEHKEELRRMAKWTRTNGYDEYGRRTILITENKPVETRETYRAPWFVRADLKIMKFVFYGALAMTVVLGLACRGCAGIF